MGRSPSVEVVRIGRARVGRHVACETIETGIGSGMTEAGGHWRPLGQICRWAVRLERWQSGVVRTHLVIGSVIAREEVFVVVGHEGRRWWVEKSRVLGPNTSLAGEACLRSTGRDRARVSSCLNRCWRVGCRVVEFGGKTGCRCAVRYLVVNDRGRRPSRWIWPMRKRGCAMAKGLGSGEQLGSQVRLACRLEEDGRGLTLDSGLWASKQKQTRMPPSMLR